MGGPVSAFAQDKADCITCQSPRKKPGAKAGPGNILGYEVSNLTSDFATGVPVFGLALVLIRDSHRAPEPDGLPADRPAGYWIGGS